jgi:hypothetical protein
LLGQLPQDAAIPPTLAAEKAFAIIGEHLCNTAIAITQPDSILGPQASADLSPDLLITYGGCIISKRIKALLRNTPPREHWHISPDGEVVDTFCSLTRVIEGDPAELWELLSAFAEEGDESYAERWLQPVPVPQFPYSGMQLVGDLIGAMPEDSVLHLANSSAVRFAQLYPLPNGTQVECNRGVNGIEGSLSTAMGYAMGDSRPQFFICGEVIQKLQVVIFIEKGRRIVLAVNINQLPSQLPQNGNRHKASIDTADIPSIQKNLPLNDRFFLIGNAIFLKPRKARHAGEHRLHCSLLRTCTDHIPVGALTDNGRNGINDDGFTCAGFTGQHIKSPIKGNIRPLDHRNIFNMQHTQHTRRPPV